MLMLDLTIFQKYVYGENMQYIPSFSLILDEKKYCETALTKSITLNDETMHLSEYLPVNLSTI